VAHRGRKGADDALLLALACGATVENAARSAGVGERTVHRRLADPGFQRRLQGVRSDILQRMSGTATAAGLEALKTLLALQKEGMPPAVRRAAARDVLEIGLKLRAHAGFEQRLQALEERLGTDAHAASTAS
jgi:hypothetical protein